MALLINKKLTIFGGIEIPQVYVRLRHVSSYDGNYIHIEVECYVSKETYLLGNENSIKVPCIPMFLDVKYDGGEHLLESIHAKFIDVLTNSDENDALIFSHVKYVETITKERMRYKKVLDPSEGYPLLDEFNNFITEPYDSIPGIFDPSEIEIVDI